MEPSNTRQIRLCSKIGLGHCEYGAEVEDTKKERERERERGGGGSGTYG